MIVSRLKRALAPLCGVLAVMSFSSAHAETFGRSTIGSTPSSGLRADFKRGSKYTLTQPGMLRELCAYVDGQGSPASFFGSQYFRIVMYRDAGGVPGVIVADTLEKQVHEGDAAEWYCGGTSLQALAPGDYWIVLHTGRVYADAPYENTPIIRYYADGTTGNWYGNADAYSDRASYQFGPGGTGNGTLSAYASFVPESDLRNAGRTTVGTTPSGALRANFKRGSSFTLSEEGRLYAISAYLDGLGATSGTQAITMAVYKDNGGVPGEYVTSGGLSVQAGMPPQWKPARIPAVTLSPGKYWLVLLTYGPSIARYYADGTGNWYGNADNFLDGPSNPFGAGGTGDGTISAFITYEPGPFTESTVGAQVPGPLQRTLPENYVQGSAIGNLHPDAVVTGLNAYIDGLGGASGSQRVKLVISDAAETDIYASEERVITAGAPGQWVHFPLPPFRQRDVVNPYYVFIASGGTPGVARVYGTTGTGHELSVQYQTEPYYPPFWYDYDWTQNNVSYSFSVDVQLREE